VIRYKVGISLLCGSGFTALLSLLLGVPYFAVEWVASILLLPGGLFAAFVSRSSELYPTVIVLVGNTLLYSALAFAILSSRFGNIGMRTERLVALGLAFPVAVLVFLSFIPRYDPMWPQGMAELGRQEVDLRNAFSPGMTAEQARNVLRWKRIQFNEPLSGGSIFSRFPTEAGQFPCGYELQIVLSFGPDGKLQNRDVHRSRVCP
jgi:hypothetical protein